MQEKLIHKHIAMRDIKIRGNNIYNMDCLSGLKLIKGKELKNDLTPDTKKNSLKCII